MNYTWVAGHLGADPETRFTSSGQKVTTIRVACRTRKSGSDDTIWWKVTIWGDQFDKILPYFKKGSPIVVNGEMMKPEIFNDRDGKPQISLNIVANHVGFSPFGKGKGESLSEGQSKSYASPSSSGEPSFENPFAMGSVGGQTSYDGAGFSEEEIPF